MAQKKISAKNIARLKAIEQCGIAKVVLLAAVVREIASVAPGRRRRWKILRANHPDVLRLAATSRQSHVQFLQVAAQASDFGAQFGDFELEFRKHVARHARRES